MAIREGHVGPAETIVLLVFLISMKAFLSLPAELAKNGLSAGWLLALIGIIIGTLGFFLLAAFLRRFPGRNLIEAAEETTGQWVSWVFGLTFFCFFFLLAIIVTRQMAETVITSFLPRTPISVITVALVGAMVYGCYLGVEALSRGAMLATPFMVISLVILVLLVLPYAEFDNLFPLLGNPGSLYREGPLFSSLVAEIMLLGMITPYLRRPEQVLPIGLTAIGISAAIIILITVLFGMIFTAPLGGEISYPMYSMARLVFFGRFVQRVESIFFFIWLVGGLINLTAAFYSATLILASQLRLPVFRPLVFPLGLLLTTMTFLPESFMAALRLQSRIIWTFGWVPAFALPATLLVVAIIRGKRGDSSV